MTSYFVGDEKHQTPPYPGLLHLVNICLHTMTTISLFYLLNTIKVTRPKSSTTIEINGIPISIAFVTAMLFAVHPIHTEAICGGVGQAELACTFFMTIGLLFYLKCDTSPKFQCLTFLSAILAASSKEQGFLFLPICFLYEIITTLGTAKFNVKKLTILIGTTLVLGAIRIYYFGRPKSALFLFFDNKAAFEPSPTRELTFFYLPFKYFYLTIFPVGLCADWGDGAIPVVQNFIDSRLIIPVYTVGFMLFKIKKTINFQTWTINDKAFYIAISIYASTFLPSSNLLGAVGFVIAERVFYAPSIGFFILVAIGFNRIIEKYSKFSQIFKHIFIFTCIALSLRTVGRTWDWESDMKLSYAGLRVVDTNARIFVNVGAYIRETSSDCHRALAYFDIAVKLNPKMAKAHFNRARCFRFLIEQRQNEVNAIKQGKKLKPAKGDAPLKTLAKQSSLSLRHCMAISKFSIAGNGFAPNHVVECFLDHVNLITALGDIFLGKMAHTPEVATLALQTIDKAEQLRPDFPRVFVTKANLFLAMHQFKEAKTALKKAWSMDQRNLDVLRAVSVFFLYHLNNLP